MDEQSQLEAQSLLQLVAANVGKLVGPVLNATGKGIPELAKAGVPRTKAGKIVTPDGTEWSVTTLAHLARALKVQPWHLLLPDMKVTAKGNVVSVAASTAKQWPFTLISREDIEQLSVLELERLEKTMRTRIDELSEDAGRNAKHRKARVNDGGR